MPGWTAADADQADSHPAPVVTAAGHAASLATAVRQLQAGGMVVICDDDDRENEGDLCIAAALVTPEAIALMACQARGLICLSLSAERCDQLDLPLMVPDSNGSEATGFTVTIDAATGITTGISAADRAYTIQVAMAPGTRPNELVRPGHIFPLRASRQGVLERRGHTEASVDLTRIAGLAPGGVLCEIMNEDGSMARGQQITTFCRQYSLPMVTVDDIAIYVNSVRPASIAM